MTPNYRIRRRSASSRISLSSTAAIEHPHFSASRSSRRRALGVKRNAVCARSGEVGMVPRLKLYDVIGYPIDSVYDANIVNVATKPRGCFFRHPDVIRRRRELPARFVAPFLHHSLRYGVTLNITPLSSPHIQRANEAADASLRLTESADTKGDA